MKLIEEVQQRRYKASGSIQLSAMVHEDDTFSLMITDEPTFGPFKLIGEKIFITDIPRSTLVQFAQKLLVDALATLPGR